MKHSASSWIYLGLAASIFTAVMSSQAAAASQASALQRAELAFAKAQLKEATQQLNIYTQSVGENADTLYLKARIAVVQGQLEAARTHSQRCQQNFPEHSICHEARGETELVGLILERGVLSKFGTARRARKTLERAVELNSQNMRARLLLVRFYSLAPWIVGGSKKQARRHVAVCDKYGQGWGAAAHALYALATGDTAAAVEGFANAARLRPTDRDPALFLAQAYLADHQPEAALATLDQLVERYPAFQEAWLEMGKIAAQHGLESVRGTAALEHFLANAQDESSQRRAQAGLSLSKLYLNAGRTKDALRALKTVIAENPGAQEALQLQQKICSEAPELCTSAR